MTITNIAAYKFATLTDLKSLRARLIILCKAWGLRGTILLSTEGINLFVAGRDTEIQLLVAELRAIAGLENLNPKISKSDEQPFTRMLVRIKKEIIAFGVEGIDPANKPTPKLSAQELKQWLDEGRPVTLLDTRNDYEVKLGSFKNALAVGIDHFREFPEAVRHLPQELKRQPIVMFCTGGIRCEKAGPFMEREGFEQIFQLDGGILKYFEECGSAHYEGECFVFDQRVGVDPSLQETSTTLCFACLTPLSVEDQSDIRYLPNQSCPYCFQTSEEQMARTIEMRHAAIRKITTPLPGSQPYDSHRPVSVPAHLDGQSPVDFLHGILRHVSREEWRARCEGGLILNQDFQPVGPEQVVRGGERYLHRQPALIEPDVNVDIRILYEDEAIIVVQKPAPLPMHASGRFNRNTLQYIFTQVYYPQCPRPAHRLDANTTGIVVFARTKHFAGLLQPQFARGDVEKVYLARVQGHPPEDSFTSTASISAVAGDLGSRDIDEETGLAAHTDFNVLERSADGTALLEVHPRTGRTHQIRVHLWQLGWPVCGDQVYLPGQQFGDTQTHTIGDEPLCLHAKHITFAHPLTRERVTFKADSPGWGVDR